MKKIKKHIALFLVASTLISSSCDEPQQVNVDYDNSTESVTTETNNNTTIIGDTSKEDHSIGDLINSGVDLAQTIYEGKLRSDSLRDANEPRMWVYQIGDFYDEDDRAGIAYDKIKELGNDIYVFKKSNKKFYLIKGYGVSSKKQLEDSIPNIENRFSSRISLIDLSIVCRKLPINTDPIKYKIDGEKEYVDCKTCE